MSKGVNVYILKNDYMPEPGSWIEGIYTSKEKAEARLKLLSSGKSEYDLTEEDCDNFEIEMETLR